DVPNAVFAPAVVGVVEEEALRSGNEDTDSDGDVASDLNVVGAGVTLDLSSLVSGGADGISAFSLTADGLGNLPALTSNQDAIVYQINGNVLTAFVDVDGGSSGAFDAGTDREVFRFEITDSI